MEIRLSDGRKVRIRITPAYLLIQNAATIPLPPEPVEEIQTAAGVERVPSRPGMPSYERYQQEMLSALQKREKAQLAFVLSYSVERWEEDVTGGEKPRREWRDRVPDDWSPDESVAHLLTGNRKADYLLLNVLLTTADIESVVAAATGQLSEQEVEEATRLFRRPVQRD